MDYQLWYELQMLLFREARLLDERRFEEWLDMFTDDVIYWMPARVNPPVGSAFEDTITKPGELALFEETKETLRTRVARQRTGLAWSEEPQSRTRRLITNVEVEVSANDGEIRARSNFMLYRTQRERDEEIFIGCRDDILRRTDHGWKIAQRTILLDQVVISAKNLSSFF
jgi:3-phenylpropionate/cinnamic acid dioxygenase small subunit